LGDVPVLGKLFRNTTTTKRKQNLMVFIHPVIMRDVLSGDEYTRQKYSKLRHAQDLSKVTKRGILKDKAAKYHNTKWKPHSQKFIERELKEYEVADKILVPSSFVKKTFLENGIHENKIIKIPYAFSLKKFKSINRFSEKQENTILFVGQLSPRKGVGVLLKAFEIVKKEITNSELWLVGSLNNSISKANFQSNGIKYFGVLKGKELMDKFQRATVFCLPSFEEGLALVLTEANYFNLPIIATPNTGIEDLTINSENRLLIPPGNHLLLAKFILNVLSNHNTKTNTSRFTHRTWTDFTEQLLNTLRLIV